MVNKKKLFLAFFREKYTEILIQKEHFSLSIIAPYSIQWTNMFKCHTIFSQKINTLIKKHSANPNNPNNYEKSFARQFLRKCQLSLEYETGNDGYGNCEKRIHFFYVIPRKNFSSIKIHIIQQFLISNTTRSNIYAM